jgi:hypothetical protein
MARILRDQAIETIQFSLQSHIDCASGIAAEEILNMFGGCGNGLIAFRDNDRQGAGGMDDLFWDLHGHAANDLFPGRLFPCPEATKRIVGDGCEHRQDFVCRWVTIMIALCLHLFSFFVSSDFIS